MSKAKIISAHSALLQPIDRDYNYNGGKDKSILKSNKTKYPMR